VQREKEEKRSLRALIIPLHRDSREKEAVTLQAKSAKRKRGKEIASRSYFNVAQREQRKRDRRHGTNQKTPQSRNQKY